MEDKEKIVLRMAQLSDLHITKFRNLLEPMIDSINQEDLDLVVVTGDTVHERDRELFKLSLDWLNKIKHRVMVIPGDYDDGALWEEYFGATYSSVNLNGFVIDLLDTSFMRHRYSVGWADVIKEESPEQYEWLKEQLKVDKYHFIFSHHPIWVVPNNNAEEFITDNVRAVFSGHLRAPVKYSFNYEQPKSTFASGFISVPMKFHGNSCYALILAKQNGEMVTIPKVVSSKITAW